MQSQKPNILLIFSDQHRHDAMGCAGNPDVQTPNLDWLAAQGTRYETVWCQAPFCQPSRTSFITGLYPHQTGYKDLGSLQNPPTLMKKLQSAGYETATVGKLHYTEVTNLKQIAGSDTIDTADFNDHFKKFGWDYLLQEFDKYHHIAPGVTTPYLKYLASQSLKEQYQQQIAQHMRGTPTHWKAGTLPFAQQHDLSTYLTEQSLRWLKARNNDRPFFLKIAYVQPHPPIIADSEWANFYANKDIQLPNFDRIKTSVPVWKKHIESLERHAQIETMKKKDVTASIRQYYAMISLVDQQIGRVVDYLKTSGTLDNTTIVYTSDHGEMMGEKRLWGKMNFYHGSVQVPLIIKGHNSDAKQGHVTRKPLELLDLHEALLTLAGSGSGSGSNVNSLTAIADHKARHRTQCISQYNAFTSILRDGIRYTEHLPTKTACELFNLQNDPIESIDFAQSKGHKKLRLDASMHLHVAINCEI